MAKISDMSRKLDEIKVQFESIPDLKLTFEAAAERLATVKFQGRKLRPGPLQNALMAYFLMLDDARQAEVATAGLKSVEALLEVDDCVIGIGATVVNDDKAVAEFRDAIAKLTAPSPKRKNYRKISADPTLVDDLIPTAPPDTDPDEGEAGGEDAEPVPAKRNAPRARKS